jgi:phosphatidylserine/phosphatidylglycerophosphate/cardiolipin synthase-like enzyme
VKVRVLVSHWGANAGSHARKSIEALAAVPNVEVRVLTVPPFSGGEIPFARVSHAKFLLLDGRTAWIGTSNWEGDYFLKTRNVAVVVEDGALPSRLERIFGDDWSSAYAAPVTAAAQSSSR